jgi:Flp pilus assembly protein TadD
LRRGSEILSLATRLYPRDAKSLFELGVMRGALDQKTEELQAYNKALELEPDLLAVYPKLGMSLYSGGQEAQAVIVFRKGLQINPLSAELYHDLGLALMKRGDQAGGRRALALAAAIDPGYASGTSQP